MRLMACMKCRWRRLGWRWANWQRVIRARWPGCRRRDGDWQTTLPNQALAAAFAAFLQQYGHRCGGEGEVRQARWQENPALLFASLAAHFQPPAQRSAKRALAPQTQALLDAVPPEQRKQVQEQLVQMRQLLVLQSQALHASRIFQPAHAIGPWRQLKKHRPINAW